MVWFKRLLALAVTAALIAWLAIDDRWRALAEAGARIPAFLLALALLGLAASYLLRAARVYDEFRAEFDANGGGFGGCLHIVLWHNALVNVTPFRAGELAFPLLMRERLGLPLARTAATLLWLRIQDAAVVALLAIALWPELAATVKLALAATVVAVAAAAFWWARHGAVLDRFAGLEKLRTALRAATVSPRGWFWTLANWSAKLAALAIVLGALLPAPARVALIGVLGGELAAVLPVQGVAGFGTYEAAVAAALYPYAITPHAALPAALALHLLVLASAWLAAGAAAWLDWRRPQTVPRKADR